ncbi:CDP-alcohol phosphatidyltransferase family protein [Oscillospiraceae bacterium PP1C4]
MKRLPNLLTAMRIMLAVLLLFIPAPGGVFLCVYLLCGLTDVLDGWLARRYHTESRLGAHLDSAADFVVAAVLLWRLYPIVAPDAMLMIWVATIAALRFGAAITASLRFGVLGFLHTYGNKFTGLLLFFYPLSLVLTRSTTVIAILCTVATLSAVEELAIELTAAQWNPDRKSIFARGKNGAL